MLLIFLSCAWVAGVLLGSQVNLPLSLSLVGLIPLALLLFVREHRKPILYTGLGLFIFFLASPYAYSSLYKVDESSLRFYNDSGSVAVRGMVAGDPDVRDGNTRLVLDAAEIRLDNGWRGVEGKALVFVPRYPAFNYGGMLLVTGELRTPPMLDDFDYRGYLAHHGIYTTMLYPEIEVLDSGQDFPPLAWVYSLRGRLAQSLAGLLPEPSASLSQGIVLGIRGSIPDDLMADFSRSGTAHLLAISGLHLGIMAGVLISLGLWIFGRRHYLYVWLAMAAIWFYVLITGMHLPVVRAAIMVSLFLLAERLGRQRSAMVALTLAAAIMVGVHPYVLGDASFQLSFLAMAGLVFIYPVLRNWGRRIVAAVLGEEGAAVSFANFTVDALSATLGAIIAIWPVVAYYFGIVSFVGPLATFLALPALPGIIITGALSAILGLVAVPVAQVVGWLAWLFLSYLTLVVSGLSALSISSAEVGSISAVFIWVYYLALAAALWFNSHRKRLPGLPRIAGRLRSGMSVSFELSRPIRWLIPPLLVMAVLVSCAVVSLPDDKLHAGFLDVGEGDAILVQKGSRQVLIDGGPSPRGIALELGRRMPFWDRSIDLSI